MIVRIRSTRRNPAPVRRREAAAALELALILPVLCYICVVTIDYSRLFMAWLTLAQAAYNGAYYLADSKVAASSNFGSYAAAALADCGGISPAPTVSSSSGIDSGGNAYVQCTVTYTFATISNYPGIPTSTTLTRTLRMARCPW